MKPSVVVNICNKILFTYKQSNRHILYVSYINIWGTVSIVFFLVNSFSVVKVPKFSTVHYLSEMKYWMQTSSIWIMSVWRCTYWRVIIWIQNFINKLWNHFVKWYKIQNATFFDLLRAQSEKFSLVKFMQKPSKKAV